MSLADIAQHWAINHELAAKIAQPGYLADLNERYKNHTCSKPCEVCAEAEEVDTLMDEADEFWALIQAQKEAYLG